MSQENFVQEYFGIGIQNGKSPQNLGSLWRSAQNLGASFIFTIGHRYSKDPTDTNDAVKSIPYYHYEHFQEFYKNLPKGARLVGIEITEDAASLEDFHHPKRCVYLLGAEDHGLTKEALSKCHLVVKFNSIRSLNVSIAGSIVMYDRSLSKPKI